MGRIAHLFGPLTMMTGAAVAAASMAVSALAQDTVVEPEAPVAPSPAVDDGAPGAGSAPEGPAMWVVADDDTTIYLFGTIHVMRPDTPWRRPAVDAAFDEADVVYFEADTESPAALGEAMALTAELGLNPPGVKLSDQLSPEAVVRLERLAGEFQISMTMLENMRPWLATLTVSISGVVAAGGDPNAGVEMVLEPEAREKDKEIRYFETAVGQVRLIAEVPEAAMVRSFEDGLAYMEEEPNWAAVLEDIWAVGDVEALAQEIETGLGDVPEVKEALLTRRNKAWVVELVRLLEEEEGVFFVAVGAGHLVGDVAVQVYLAEEGYTAERF